ncbi:MAG: RIP metalloprotease RseP [Rhizobiales bacterium]|nr:RIP metalloprotease RseP [Hyphomicrobiales bacterium]
MGFLDLLFVPVNSFLLYAIPFLVALVVIVFIHELGHFLVARWCKVDVEAFAIGFGKEIVGWVDRKGTRWKICWIPLGGYVKFAGDANVASMPQTVDDRSKLPPGNFHAKPVWQRAAVVAAGPIANFLLAIAIFATAYSTFGVPYSEPRVDEIVAGSVAEKAGFQVGDYVRAIDGREIKSFNDIQNAVWFRGGEQMSIVLDRSGQLITVQVAPEIREESDGFGGKLKVGLLGIRDKIGAEGITYERLSPVDAVAKGAERTWFIISTTFKFLGKLFQGQEDVKQIGGIGSMAKAAGDAASAGVLQFVAVVAFLSVSIGLINLFPIPMLDGGHLVYYAIEAVRGKPLGPVAQEWGFRIGFSLVLMLMLLGNGNDVIKGLSSYFGG